MEKKLTDKEIEVFFKEFKKDLKKANALFAKHFPNSEKVDNSEYRRILKEGE